TCTSEPSRHRSICLLEGIEYQVELFLLNTDARVNDSEFDHVVPWTAAFGLNFCNGDLDFTMFGEFDRIANKIEDDLPQTERISDHPIGYIFVDLIDQVKAPI